ncbi:MAG: acyl-CoA dehydrogenase family protein [Sphingobium sp.]
MDFDLNEEQTMLRDMVARFGADHYDPVKRLAYLRQDRGFAEENWKMLAETGLLAFALPEEAGGFGGRDADILATMEALGGFVAVEPVLATILLGMGILWEAGTEAQREELIALTLAGERFPALALYEHQGRFDSKAVRAQAVTDPAGTRISGVKQLVLGGAFATDLIVAARLSDGGDIGLFIVDKQAEGVSSTDYRLADGSFASDICFDNAPAQAMTRGEDALNIVLDRARLAICAELVGLADLMFRQTLDYMKTRKQFGMPLGAFQALQHRMADCYTLVELSRSQLYRAAGSGSGDSVQRAAAIIGAKAYISESAMQVGEEAIQFHGGIGVTEELMVGQAFKRVMTLVMLLGDADYEVDQYIGMTALS